MKLSMGLLLLILMLLNTVKADDLIITTDQGKPVPMV